MCGARAVPPLRLALQLPALALWRRMLGLWVYFYATLHLLNYAWFDMDFALSDVAGDIIKRPFIRVGFLAFVLLSALALTLPKRMARLLGGKKLATPAPPLLPGGGAGFAPLFLDAGR